ncbi:LysR substrate-binding domain-containing protein [Streptomyces sp. S.PB5]|uniref:LysR substrate-binding domain-containing protein n=1 Tax=Streptomyces sp. S.PB5 TaxID=3020844 RepID=UPI0025AF82A2|nr:LysR substrate-binding domain-containing protein [Streptomyces sp. S.PB5]MDN3022708.1 LysR substrate-binding domain-containing protein [Streptomyces sp. S.PB5]
MEQVSETFTVDLRRLTVLRELQRRGSLARTAEALHLTPSAVSQQIAALSRELGTPLTERDGRGVRLTGQARVLLTHADAIAAQLERARADLAAYDGGGRGSVTIGCFSSGILGLLPGVLRGLRERLPDVRVDVVEAEPPDLFTALDAGQVDVAVAVDFAATPPHTDRRYSRVDLLRDAMDLVVPADHRLAGRAAPVPLRELATEAWIAGDARSCVGAIARAVCATAGFTPDIRHAVNDWGALAALVEAGAGVALIPRLVRPLYEHRRLAVLATAGEAPARNVFAAVRTGAERDPVLAAVRDQLRETARSAVRPAPPL